jgi:hypothetical protein
MIDMIIAILVTIFVDSGCVEWRCEECYLMYYNMNPGWQADKAQSQSKTSF